MTDHFHYFLTEFCCLAKNEMSQDLMVCYIKSPVSPYFSQIIDVTFTQNSLVATYVDI